MWLTEFGYDATTKPSPAKGNFRRWQGVTDEQQAQWIARSFLCFSATSLDRAYLYWFNDKDKPGVHAASGVDLLTGMEVRNAVQLSANANAFIEFVDEVRG